jgi:Tellurite resistance protein TehB.
MDGFRVKPAELLVSYVNLFTEGKINGPILDLACGNCRNGIFLAKKGLEVICCDVSEEALKTPNSLQRYKGLTSKSGAWI